MKTYSGKSTIADADEPLPYRWTVVGLLTTVVGLSVLLVLASAISLWLMWSILTLFGIVCIIDAWLVTRGLLFHSRLFQGTGSVCLSAGNFAFWYR